MDFETKDRVKRYGNTVEVVIPTETEYLDLVRQVVNAVAAKMGMDQDAQDRLEISVDEACTNIIEHAYAGDRVILKDKGENEIEIKVSDEEDRLTVSIIDHGAPFDVTVGKDKRIESVLKKMHVTGYGLYIINHFVDEVEWNHIPGVGNELKLIQHVAKA